MTVPLQLEEAELELCCAWCGDSYPAEDGPALLYALKSPCPRCGGEFHLVARAVGQEQMAHAA